MRTEYWQRSEVRGWKKTDGDVTAEAREDVLHRRGEDPMVMACRRNREMAGMDRIRVSTAEAFAAERTADGDKRPDEIPRMGSQGEEWDWDT